MLLGQCMARGRDKKMNKKTTMKALAGASCLAVSVVAGATTWGYETNVSGTFSAAGNPGPGGNFTTTSLSVYCAASVCHTVNDFALGTPVIRLKAYRTTEAASPLTTGNVAEGTQTWAETQLVLTTFGPSGYSNKAFGIKAPDDGSNQERGIDNNGYDDVLLIDFMSAGWDVKSITLGFACNINTGTGQCISGATTANVKAWIGNTLPTAFSVAGTAGFDAASGFKPLDFGATSLSAGTGGNTVPITEGTTHKGQYLVLTGDLARNMDSFTLKGIKADKVVSPPGGNRVPVPGSLPLVGLALLALAWVSRSRRLRTIPIRIRR